MTQHNTGNVHNRFVSVKIQVFSFSYLYLIPPGIKGTRSTGLMCQALKNEINIQVYKRAIYFLNINIGFGDANLILTETIILTDKCDFKTI